MTGDIGPCPQCGSTLDSRDDAIVHMVKHVGDDDVSTTEGER